MREKITVEVPASSGNLGCGFDVLSAALEIRNRFIFEVSPGKFSVTVFSEGCDGHLVQKDSSNIIWRAAGEVFKKANFNPHRLGNVKIRAILKTPLMKGLGSSGTAYLAGAVFANEISGKKLSDRELLEIVSRLEGHWDNVVSSYFGGIGIYAGERFFSIKNKFKNPLCLAIPDIVVETSASRKVLPQYYKRKDVVFNLSRIASLIWGIATKSIEPFMFEDKIHTPYRKKFIKGFSKVREAALSLGAKGFFISGSGSSVAAVAPDVKSARAIALAMKKSFKKASVSCNTIITKVSNRGVSVKREVRG